MIFKYRWSNKVWEVLIHRLHPRVFDEATRRVNCITSSTCFARIIRILKVKIPTSTAGFRSISVLTVSYEVFQRRVLQQLCKLIENNIFLDGVSLFKFNNGNTRATYEIYSKLTIKVPERCHWRCSDVFIVNFE